MATIKIIDAVGAIIDVDVREGSSLDEYVSSLPGLIFKGRFDEIFPLPLNELDDSIEGGEIGFEFDAPVKLDVEGVAMTVGGGASLSIDIRTPEDGSLFESDYYDTDIPIDAGHRYLGLGFTARASVTGEAAGGERTFGIDAEGAIGFRNFRRYGEGDGFGEALKETLSSFVIPAKVDDLGELPSGVVATAEGRGTLKLSVEAELLTVTNPLASLAIPADLGTLDVSAGGSVTVAASFELTGEYQVRALRPAGSDGKVQLGFYRKRGARFDVTATAAAGVGVQVGDFDLAEMLLGLLVGDPDTSILDEAGLDDEHKARVEAAVKESIERSLELALTFELEESSSRAAAFLFEIDVASLNDAGRAAVDDAMGGDLTSLLSSAASPLPGIVFQKNILTRIRSRKHALKLNVFGLYNAFSISELISKSNVLVSPETGELIITDTNSASRIRGKVFYLAREDKLRELVAEHLVITVVYRAVGGMLSSWELESSHSYFELHAATNWQTMKDNLDVAEALELLDAGGREKKDLLAPEGREFGRSFFLAETGYDDAACRRVFLDEQGRARSEEWYEAAGRQALGSLLQPGDPNAKRRKYLLDEDNWRLMKSEAGSFRSFRRRMTPHELQRLEGDYFRIRWWAKSMGGVSRALAEMEKFLDETPEGPERAEGMKGRREDLTKLLGSAMKNNRARFGDPWGLVALDLASGRRCTARVRVTSNGLTFNSERPAES